MNQFGLYYIHIWKCHKEALCIAILNKNVIFFKNEQEGKTSPFLGVDSSRRGRGLGKDVGGRT
jgi:hypothetical protein